RLRQAFAPEEWRAMARTQLSRFWLTSRRYIDLVPWGGRPGWLDDLLATLAQLPDGAGEEFSVLWREAQAQADAAVGPSMAEGGFHLGVAEWIRFQDPARSVLVLETPLDDARFALRVLLETDAQTQGAQVPGGR